MIDLGRIDPTKPVDLAALCNTRSFLLDVANRHYGFQLTDEGADEFKAKVNLEVGLMRVNIISFFGGFLYLS